MPLQNRVTPLGELVAHPARGLVYGNRGCIHDAEGRIRPRFAVKRWIACRLQFKGWHRSKLMQPGRFTELFFLDEATALAAGHRPCALCRREDYTRFVSRWAELHPGELGADAIDAALDAERLDRAARGRRLHVAQLDDLSDGAFILRDGEPHLVLGSRLPRWTPAGYVSGERRPTPGVCDAHHASVARGAARRLGVGPAARASDGDEPRLVHALDADPRPRLPVPRRMGLWYHSAVASADQSGFTVWLTGLSGAGKTTIGRAVARRARAARPARRAARRGRRADASLARASGSRTKIATRTSSGSAGSRRG